MTVTVTVGTTVPGSLALLEFAGDADFLVAAAAGSGAVVAVALAQLRSPPRVRPPATLAGLAIWVPAAAVLAARLELPRGVAGGLAVLGVVGALIDRGEIPAVAIGIAAIPGAWLLAWHGDLVPVTWIRALVLVVTVLGGATLESFDRRFVREGYAPVFLAASALGVYYTVPDPYEAIILFGCAVPAALLGWPRAMARFGASGALPVVGLLAWTVARGGYGRQSSIIGGLACLALLAIEPLHRGLRHDTTSGLDALPFDWRRWPAAVGAQLALVTIASRVAGVRSPTPYEPGGTLWRGEIAGAVVVVGASTASALICLHALRRHGRGVRPGSRGS